jgi:hypothetical protein
MTSSFTAADGSRSIAIVRRMKQLRDDLKRGQIGELTFLFEFGALERELEALRTAQPPTAPP